MLDRSDRPWMPIHTGSKNRVRLTWASRTTARRTEMLNGVPVDPRADDQITIHNGDLAAAARQLLSPEELIAILKEKP